jgi:hypothetical protein
MSDRIHCDKHGETKATYVCLHVVQTLKDRKARGFAWCVADDGYLYADCSACNALSEDEWRELIPTHGRVLCFGCFKVAAALNDADVSDVKGGYLQ